MLMDRAIGSFKSSELVCRHIVAEPEYINPFKFIPLSKKCMKIRVNMIVYNNTKVIVVFRNVEKKVEDKRITAYPLLQ